LLTAAAPFFDAFCNLLDLVERFAYNASIAIKKIGRLAVATLTIRNLDETIKQGLRQLAARHGRSMEEEVRQILRQTVSRPLPAGGLGSRLAKRFAAVGGVDLPPVMRSSGRQPPTFGEETP
jgi:plasmid stability protein